MTGPRLFSLVLAAALFLEPAPRAHATAAATGGAAAVDLTGHWEAPVSGDGRTFMFLFDFAQKGSVLTGTVEISTRDQSFPIADGRVDGSKVTFKGFGDWRGELSGEDLKLTRGLDYGKKQDMVAHRTPK